MMNLTPEATESAWKPCDLRGPYPQAVSPGLFRDIGGAVATVLAPRSRVVVAGDFRLSTPELVRALSAGLLEAGAQVLLAGQGPTPLAYFTAAQANADAVLIVTASHNPAEHNGLKLMLGSMPPAPEQLAGIRSLAESRNFRTGQGRMEVIDLRPLYTQTMLERWGRLSDGAGSRVVLDPGNGAWSEIAPAIFARLGFDMVCISCVADGRFPDRSPDCARASNLSRLRSAVAGRPAAIGIAWDGDGDRVAFIDENAGYVSPDEIAILLARAVLAQEPATGAGRGIVVDLKHSEMVRRAILADGGVPLLERTGHAFMRSRMVAEGARLGLDACGHYFFDELRGGDDGMFAALFLLDIVRRSRTSLAELRRSVPQIFSTPEVRIPADQLSYLKAAAALTGAFPEATLMEIDGLRLVMPDGVALVRESGTEAVLSLRVEGFDQESYRRILSRCMEVLPEAADQLGRDAVETSATPEPTFQTKE